MTYTVTAADQNQRLDKFLTIQLKDITRSQIKKLIQGGAILVNDQPTSVHRFLKEGDVVTVNDLKPLPKPHIPAPIVEKVPSQKPAIPDPTIVAETADWVVINKPSGLLTHPTTANEPHTVAGWLRKKYPEIAEVGDASHRAGIVHRLDRDVSGLLVAAKTKPMFDHLKLQFKKRRVAKEYCALVYGKIEDLEGNINIPIGRNKDGQFVAHPTHDGKKLDTNDRVAKTQYWVLEYIKDYSLLRVKILTGRTHQIRVHLSAIGHPILGDIIYKPKNKIFTFLRRRIKVVDPGRIFLHSTKLGFYDLDKTRREFESPLPPQLENYLAMLKK